MTINTYGAIKTYLELLPIGMLHTARDDKSLVQRRNTVCLQIISLAVAQSVVAEINKTRHRVSSVLRATILSNLLE